jgi:hypothetical protein
MPFFSGILLFGVIFGALVGFITLLYEAWTLVQRLRHNAESTGAKPKLLQLAILAWSAFSSILAGFTGGALVYLAFAVLLRQVYWHSYDVPFMAMLGPPLVVAVMLASVIVEVGLLGNFWHDDVREWWASFSGWLMIDATVWVGITGLSLFGPLGIMRAPAWGQALLGSGWVATAVGGVMAGKSSRTGTGRGNQALEALALVAPPVFLAGLLALIALLIDLIQGNAPPAAGDLANYFAKRLNDWSAMGLLLFAAGCVALVSFSAWRVDVNTFSLHGLYGNRLVRCYLGASRPKEPNKSDRPCGAHADSQGSVRQPDPITGFDVNDDFPLQQLIIGAVDESPTYWGPFPLINTAMNLTQGDELAWQQRKAESFVLSPRFCGSESTGYRELHKDDPSPLRLGTAVTLSGAAVSPNMGYHSSPAVTALLTAFNVRLGGWVTNPRDGTPGNTGPRLGLLYLIKELFGRTNFRARNVYLSDGGHFENLGVYELVRRRCRYIVACDAEEDAGYNFGGLGALVRKCYTDFGIPIEIDVSPIRPQGDDHRSRWHCALGRIRYDQVDDGAIAGVLVYVKSSLSGDEPADVLTYAREHPPFPHQSTVNQFFTESQFESYRALGCHIAGEVFFEAAQQVDAPSGMSDTTHRLVVNGLFSKLHSRWFPPPPGFDDRFLQSVRGFVEVERALRTDPNLREFSQSLYPEFAADSANGAAGAVDRRAVAAAELHLVSQMLQVMENAWLVLHLEGYFAHPMNRGWMNTFACWANSRKFRRYWPLLRGEFSKDFVRFCESTVTLNAGRLQVTHLPPKEDLLGSNPLDGSAEQQRQAIRTVIEEFALEWPRQDPLHRAIKQAWDWGRDDASVWLLTLAAEEPAPPGAEPLQNIGCGIVLAWGSDHSGDVHLLMWMRGCYRDLGLGRQAIRKIFKQMADSGRYAQHTLRTFYPAEVSACGGDHLRSGLWRSFFTFYGFRTLTKLDGGKQGLVLQASPAEWRLFAEDGNRAEAPGRQAAQRVAIPRRPGEAGNVGPKT